MLSRRSLLKAIAALPVVGIAAKAALEEDRPVVVRSVTAMPTGCEDPNPWDAWKPDQAFVEGEGWMTWDQFCEKYGRLTVA